MAISNRRHVQINWSAIWYSVEDSQLCMLMKRDFCKAIVKYVSGFIEFPSNEQEDNINVNVFFIFHRKTTNGLDKIERNLFVDLSDRP